MSTNPKEFCNRCGMNSLTDTPLTEEIGNGLRAVRWCPNCKGYFELVTVPIEDPPKPA